jgi:hypothetical protein
MQLRKRKKGRNVNTKKDVKVITSETVNYVCLRRDDEEWRAHFNMALLFPYVKTKEFIQHTLGFLGTGVSHRTGSDAVLYVVIIKLQDSIYDISSTL